jgi:hypothetical protein
MPEERESFKGWAILELMGHRRLSGHVSEEVIAGAAFVRIDVPDARSCTCGSADPGSLAGRHAATSSDDKTVATQFYAPGAVYCITPTTEETARRVAEATNVAPVSEWDLPRRPALTAARDEDEPDF